MCRMKVCYILWSPQFMENTWYSTTETSYTLYTSKICLCAPSFCSLCFIFCFSSVCFMYTKSEDNRRARASELPCLFPNSDVILTSEPWCHIVLFAITSLPLGCINSQTCIHTCVQGGLETSVMLDHDSSQDRAVFYVQGKKHTYQVWTMPSENVQSTEHKT